MKPEGAFFSGAILGVAGIYLYNKYSESCDDLKGGAADKDENLDKIYNSKQTVSEINSFCSKNNKKYSCKNGVLFNKDKTTLIRYSPGKFVKEYTIPNSVTTIGQQAFYYCHKLTIINIPKSVTSIGEQAFYSCSSLTSITIPKSVTSIGSYAFGECTSLTNISVEKDNNVYSSIDGVLFNKNQTELIVYPSRKNDNSYNIPNLVTSIEEFAFAECSSLKTIIIHDSVTSIGDYAFFKCTSLKNITIPTSVTSIGSNPFSGCSSLETITIPSNLITTINVSNVFSDYDNLTNIQDEQGNSYKIVYDSKSKNTKFVLQ